MKLIYASLLVIISLFTIQCTSSQQSTETIEETLESRPEPNTVFKVFPDGKKFLLEKREYNNGLLSKEYLFAARPEMEGDSSYYFYGLGYMFDYRYDEQDRLIEKTQFLHDSSTVLHIDQYLYAGDSMVHTRQAYDHRDSRLLFTKLIEKEWYLDNRLVRRFKPDGYRDDYVMEYWEYDGNLLSTYTINNMTNDVMWYQGEHIGDYNRKTIYYDENGHPIRDEVEVKDSDGLIFNWTTNYYDEYGTIYKQKVTDDTDMYDAKNIRGTTRINMITPNRLRGAAKDPMDYLNAVISDGAMERLNFMEAGEHIYKRSVVIKNRRIIAMTDSVKPTKSNGGLTSFTRKYSYDEEGHLTREEWTIVAENYGVRESVTTYSYHPNGMLKMHHIDELYDNRRSVTWIYYNEGSQKSYSERWYGRSETPDSTVTFFDSIRGIETGEVMYRGGVIVSGQYDFYDKEGRLIREFDERDEHHDIQHYYDSEGQKLRSEYYKVRYHRFHADEPVTRDLLYELWYGKVVKN